MNNLIYSFDYFFFILRHALLKVLVEKGANIKIEHPILLRFSFEKFSSQMHPLHNEIEYRILRIHEI